MMEKTIYTAVQSIGWKQVEISDIVHGKPSAVSGSTFIRETMPVEISGGVM